MKSIEECILERLKDFDTIFVNQGEWTGEQYMEIIMPLHNAFLELSKTVSQEMERK